MLVTLATITMGALFTVNPGSGHSMATSSNATLPVMDSATAQLGPQMIQSAGRT